MGFALLLAGLGEGSRFAGATTAAADGLLKIGFGGVIVAVMWCIAIGAENPSPDEEIIQQDAKTAFCAAYELSIQTNSHTTWAEDGRYATECK